MPKPAASQTHVDATAAQMHCHPDLGHLRVRKRGAAILIESGPTDDPVKHARLVRGPAVTWTLQIADHRGQWGSTGLCASREQLIDALVGEFGWVLTDIAGDYL